MYKLTNQLVNKKMTPKDAEHFLTLNNFPGQRKLQESKAKRYSELIVSGFMRPVEISFALLPDGNRYLMNGQHVCQGCIWSGKEMTATISYFKCESWSDALELFATFDVHAARTQGQVFHAARGLFKDDRLHTVPLRLLNSAGSALVVIEPGFAVFSMASRTADKTSKIHLVEKYADEVMWVASIPQSEIIWRVGVLAAAFDTYRKNKVEAEKFWKSVVEGISFKSKLDPAKKCRDYILDGAKKVVQIHDQVMNRIIVSASVGGIALGAEKQELPLNLQR